MVKTAYFASLQSPWNFSRQSLLDERSQKNICHHHDVAPPPRISMTLSHHPYLSSIAPGRSSRLHPVVYSWTSCLCSSIWRGPLEYVTYEYTKYYRLNCFSHIIYTPQTNMYPNIVKYLTHPIGWLVVWFLWHIKLCRLFNAKSMFIQIFQTIQFSMSTQFNCQKTFVFQATQFCLTVLIQTI